MFAPVPRVQSRDGEGQPLLRNLEGQSAAHHADEESGGRHKLEEKAAPKNTSTELVCSVSVVLLVLVCTQNACYSLLRRLAMGIRIAKASDSSVLAMQELIKLVVAARMMVREPSYEAGVAENGRVRFVVTHSSKMLVPAAIFLLMNVLGFLALRNIPAGLFAVLQQCKIVTTAVLTRLMLQRRLSWSKWRALLLILAGIVLLTHEEHSLRTQQLALSKAADAAVAAHVASLRGGLLAAGHEREAAAQADVERGQGSLFLGVAAVTLETVLSGFATVYFERVVKSTPLSIWHRNVQLACWSLAIFVPMAVLDAPSANPLSGWSHLEVINSLVGAAGGILVALCIVRFDSIIKSIAVGASIVLTAGASHIFLSGPMTLPIVVASAVVIIGTINYSF